MRYVSKQFLSPCVHESGSIICKLETPLFDEMSLYRAERGGDIDASIRVSDCSDHAVIDFNAYGEEAYAKRLSKIDKMIEEITLFREKYIEAWTQNRKDVALKITLSKGVEG